MNLRLPFAFLALLCSSVAFAQLPVITSAPRSPANPIPATYSVSFSVTASNAVSLQWLKNGQPISGAVNSTLSFPSLRVSDAGSYSVRVSNSFGSVTSSPEAVLQVSVPYVMVALNRNWRDPEGLALNPVSRMLYIAESGAHRIYALNLNNGALTLLAGSGSAGSANGIGSAASFRVPSGLALDASRTTLFVADTGNHAVRKINLATGEVSSVVGRAGTSGFADGIGNSALFNTPFALAVGADGTVYVSDYGNHAIRAVNPVESRTTTFAGNLTGISGNTDGAATAAARFRNPAGIAVAPDGSALYVADFGNNTIRRISLTGAATVSTVAGAAGITGSADGTGANASFNQPRSVTVSAAGNIYVADSGNFALRKISPAGVVSWLVGGARRNFSSSDGIGSEAVIYSPATVAVFGDTELLLVADAGNFSFDASISLAGPADPQISAQPASRSASAGDNFTLAASLSLPPGIPTTYQWFRDGVALSDTGAISGSTQATLTFTRAQVTDSGSYTLRVTNIFGTVTTAAAVITIAPAAPSVAGRLINLSILTSVATPGDSFTMGYVVGGDGTSGPKPLVIRAAGPSLGALGVPGTLDDPRIELFAGSTRTGENDNWGGSAALANALSAVGAFAYVGPTSRDAATLANISTRDNSVRVSGVGNGTGTVIAEIYDATPAASFTAITPRLINVSVLKHIGAGLTAGFVIGGSGSRTILIRAVGPTLGAAPFNVAGVVQDPQITLFGAGSERISSNDNWGGTAALVSASTAVGAFPLPPASRDAALLATLTPGNYTVQVSGVGNTTGFAVVEVYEVP